MCTNWIKGQATLSVQKLKCSVNKQTIRLRKAGTTDNKQGLYLELGCWWEVGSSIPPTGHVLEIWEDVPRMGEAASGTECRGEAGLPGDRRDNNNPAYNFLNLDSDSILQINTSNIFCQGFHTS